MRRNSSDGQLCLFGSVVNDDGSVSPRRYVVIVGGVIRSVSETRPPGLARVNYTLKDDELIFPSFLDLHTHTSYNMLPLWHSPYWAWDNRFQWRANADYEKAIGATNRAIVSRSGEGSKVYEAFSAFSELMAVAGGTTLLQENAALDGGGFPRETHLLIRSTGWAEDLGLDGTSDVMSVIDFFEPDPYTAPYDPPPRDTSSWMVRTATKGLYDHATFVNDFALSVSGTRTRGTIVHLAEGRSGFLQTLLGPDAYTRAEFETFVRYIRTNFPGDKVEMVRQAHLVLIHGCGMNTASAGIERRRRPRAGSPSRSGTAADTIDFLKTYGIGIVWSPVSNLLLYQDTTNVLPLLDAGVPVALGTDWTPSGSKTVWEEAKFAADFLESRGWKGDVDLTCFRAITTVPADMLGLKLGRVREGCFGDLIILRRPRGVRDALKTFRQAGDDEVRVVLVGGVPLYGDPDVLKALGASPLPLPGETASSSRDHWRAASPGRRRSGAPSLASTKAFALPPDCEISLDDITRGLEAADHVVGWNRPRLLASDDDDYLHRMAELRAWVDGFGSSVQPTPKPVPPPPTGLAPGELEWMYNPSLDPGNRVDPKVTDLLGRMAPCRDEECLVPQLHPYYHGEVLSAAGDSYGVRVPCMPVVPVLTARQQLFVMGDFPTAKFTARSTNALPVITGDPEKINEANRALASFMHPMDAQPRAAAPHLVQTYIEEIDTLVRGAFARPDIPTSNGRSWGNEATPTPPRRNEFFVPVADVFAPMQDANYFDGYKVRNVAAGVFFQESFLKAVGVDIGEQVWLTNMIKCFLFHPSNAASYQALGWTDVRVQASYDKLLPIGKVCSQWINQEVGICDPKLVLTVGKPPCVLLHNVPFEDAVLQSRVYNELMGVRLPAHDSRLENAIATKLKLTSRDTPPFTRRGEKRPSAPPAPAVIPLASLAGARATAPKAPPPERPVSIERVGPWADYNVFHMMHPQAVMMAQTAVSNALRSAIALRIGPKASGMSVEELTEAMSKYIRTRGTPGLLAALPYGQRDTFFSNATLLERHAVTLANFADTLVELDLVHRRRVSGDRVLDAQAETLAQTYHLDASADAELKRLRKRRDDDRARIEGYLHKR